MRTAFLVSLFILAHAGYLVATFEEECEDEEADALTLAGLSIYSSSSAAVTLNVSTVADVRVSVDIAIQAKVSIDLQVADSDDDNPAISVAASVDISVSIKAAYSYFYNVCPAIWYRVAYWKWYIYYKGECCWPINNIWLPRCICEYCKLRPYYHDTWFTYLRCELEYSWIYVPSVCYGPGGWRLRYLRQYLPRDCVCKSYLTYRLVIHKQCAVETTIG